MARGAWAWVVLGLLALGCQATPQAGDACTRSADCAAPLVCAIGRCREACVRSHDCPSLARCLVEPSSGAHVCSLAVDSCRTHACPRGFVCRTDECVNACGSLVECPDGACVDGACVTGSGIDAGMPMPDAAASDVGPDAAIDAAPTAVTTCPGATLVVPTSSSTDVPYDPTGLTSTSGGCDPDLPDAYFVVRLAQRSLVAAWTAAPLGGALGWVTDCSGNTPPACDSHCSAYVETSALLDAGDHVLVMDDASATTLHVITYPLGADVVAEEIAVAGTAFDLTATLTAGTGLTTCTSAGPTHLWWFQQCQLGPTRTLDLSSCGSSASVDLAFFDDGNGSVLGCSAADVACAAGGQIVTRTLAEGPTVVVFTASGHGATDVGAVHVHGAWR